MAAKAARQRWVDDVGVATCSAAHRQNSWQNSCSLLAKLAASTVCPDAKRARLHTFCTPGATPSLLVDVSTRVSLGAHEERRSRSFIPSVDIG